MPMDRLVQLVERGSDQLRRGASDDRRKAMGQYYTPLGIAEFMASLPDLPVARMSECSIPAPAPASSASARLGRCSSGGRSPST